MHGFLFCVWGLALVIRREVFEEALDKAVLDDCRGAWDETQLSSSCAARFVKKGQGRLRLSS